MKKYIINKILVDGYERVAVIQEIEDKVNYIVHFLEYDEYLENCEVSDKRHIGDVIEGDMSIDLVAVSRKVNSELMHRQRIKESSHIEAIVEICGVRDNYSIYAKSSIAKDKILIEFEDMVDYEVGDKIFVEGSLEFSQP